MKKNTKKRRCTTGPKHRANESKSVSSQNAASTETGMSRAVDPIMHTMCLEYDVPINWQVRRYLTEIDLNDQEEIMRLNHLLLEQYAWDLVRILLQRSPIRQDYLDYRAEQILIDAVLDNFSQDLDISHIIDGIFQFIFEHALRLETYL
jgi:hypothetical protein